MKGAVEVPIGILYSHFTEHGGAENVILKQVEMLYHRGYAVKCYFAYVDKRLVKPTSNPHCFVDDYFGNEIPNFKTARILLSLPLAALATKKLADTSTLICHGYGPGPWIGYVQKKLRGIKYVSYIHFLPRMFYLTPEETKLWRFDKTRNTIYLFGALSRSIVKEIDCLAVSNSDKVLVNSNFTGRRVRKVYGVEPEICYPPVDTGVFKPLSEEETRLLRAQFGWPLIVSSGRIVPIKRWEWLIRTLPNIKKVFPSVTLAIAGETPEGSEGYVGNLERLAEELGVRQNLKLLGFKPVDELVQLYNAADVYAYPTPMEDFGLGPVEAMSCGTPSVVWNDGGGPCETTIEGVTGFRAHPYDVEDFGEKIMKAFDIDKRSIANRLHKFVEDKFSCAKHLATLEKTLKDP
jgi:glycosyltransferase involved in cell wall biosynthesis